MGMPLRGFSLVIAAAASLACLAGKGFGAIPSPRLALPDSIGRQLTDLATNEQESEELLNTYLSFIQSNKLQEVEPLLLSYLRDHPRSWRGYYQLGYVYFRLHNFPASIKALQESIELNSHNADTHKILGLDFVMVNNYDAAGRALLEAASLAPESAEIHYFLGRFYYTRGICPLARQEFELAIRLDPANIRAYDNLGLAMEDSGDDKAAVEDYRKAMELSSQKGLKYEWPYINLSSLYNRLNYPKLALEYSAKALEFNPNSSPAYFQMGKAYRSLEDWQQAAAALEEAVALDSHFGQAYYVLSFVYRKLGKTKESREAMAAFRMLPGQTTDSAPAGMGIATRRSKAPP
jgi:tetratricopeptide (TPR) repeat protein